MNRSTLLPAISPHSVTVAMNADGDFECCAEGATGTPIVGRGNSVAEAVGDWVINMGIVSGTCDPPELIEKYKIAGVDAYGDHTYKKYPSRSEQ